MRIAYDSVTAKDIPLGARIVCGYVDGIYKWTNADWAQFPYAIKVGIAVSPYTNAGQVLDVETGDATPAQAPHWVLMRRAAGVDPTVYINRSNWAATRTAFQQQGLPEPHYWLAAYDGIAEVPAGTVAKQFANSTLSGGHYDLSAVADYWPGVDSHDPNATAVNEVRVPQEVPLTDAELVTMHHLMQWVCFGQIDGSQQQAFLDAIKAGKGMNSIFDGWYASPTAVAWRDKLAKSGVAGPPGIPGVPGTTGPQGPPGPAADTSKLAPMVHEHTVTGKAS